MFRSCHFGRYPGTIFTRTVAQNDVILLMGLITSISTVRVLLTVLSTCYNRLCKLARAGNVFLYSALLKELYSSVVISVMALWRKYVMVDNERGGFTTDRCVSNFKADAH